MNDQRYASTVFDKTDTDRVLRALREVPFSAHVRALDADRSAPLTVDALLDVLAALRDAAREWQRRMASRDEKIHGRISVLPSAAARTPMFPSNGLCPRCGQPVISLVQTTSRVRLSSLAATILVPPQTTETVTRFTPCGHSPDCDL